MEGRAELSQYRKYILGDTKKDRRERKSKERIKRRIERRKDMMDRRVKR